MNAHQIYDSASPSIFFILSNDSSGQPNIFGTGFVIAPRTLATNAHVIVGGAPVVAFGTTRIPTHVLNADPTNDLAILTVDTDLPASSKPLVLSTQKPGPGDTIVAIGNPEGLEKTLSLGIISAVRNLSGRTLLQITSPISHGSSGGPIFNDHGEVVAVTVSSRTDGQNLNFAIPVTYLDTMLHAKPHSVSASLTPAELHALGAAFSKEQFSKDLGSPYQVRLKNLRTAIRLAALQTDTVPELSLLMCMVYNESPDEDGDAVADAARKLIATSPAPDGEAHAVLAFELSYEAEYLSPGPELSSLLKQGESEADTSIKTGGRGSATADYAKGIVLSLQNRPEGIQLLQKSLTEDSAVFACGYNLRLYAYRHLITLADSAKSYDDAEKYFEGLVATGEALPSDWSWEGTRRNSRKDFAGAAAAFEKTESAEPVNACTAAANYSQAKGDYSDKVLEEGKKCFAAFAKYDNTTGLSLNGLVARVHLNMATILNIRGRYADALSFAQEGTTLDPSENDLLYEEARALQKLGRPQECISAAQQAVAASDGKNARYHFQLGSCYFDAANWDAAAASLRTAADKDPSDAAAAFRLAQTMKKRGNAAEAKVWSQEALKRHPDEALKAEILASQR